MIANVRTRTYTESDSSRDTTDSMTRRDFHLIPCSAKESAVLVVYLTLRHEQRTVVSWPRFQRFRKHRYARQKRFLAQRRTKGLN